MVYFYLDESCKMPYNKFVILCKKTNVAPETFGRLNRIKLKNNKPKKIVKPTLNEKLAELLGIMYGDGCLTTHYATTVVCNAISDKLFVTARVAKIFYELFGIKPHISVKRNAIHCRIYSKELFNFFYKQYGFPIGEKKNRIEIPKNIKQNMNYSVAFIRGLFDTDGGFHRHNPKSAKIEITSYTLNFLKEVYAILEILDMRPVLMKNRINIIAKNKIDRFFETIKPKNPKHVYKYLRFKETGQVPRHKDINYAKLEELKIITNKC